MSRTVVIRGAKGSPGPDGTAAVNAHAADTTAVHGIADTSLLLDTGDIGTTVDAFGAASTAQAAAIASAASDATTKANAAQAAAIAASQPVDSDLTAIAALSTTSFGRGLLALADAAALTAANNAATLTTAGIVELATTTETTTGTDATRAVTPAGVAAAVAALINGAPGALDTLDELAAAFGDDANFAATMTTALAGKQPIDADLTALAAAGNSAVLAATTASFLTADETKLDGIEALADVTDTTNVDAAGAVMLPLVDRVNGEVPVWDEDNQIWVSAPQSDPAAILVDEDDFASNLADKAPTQQSTKAYVDGRTPARAINPQTGTTYDFVLTDNNNDVTFSNASSMTATVLPQATTAWLANTELAGTNLGAGTLTLAGSGAATITAPPGLSLVLPVGGSFSLKRTSANQWSAAGQFLPADVSTLLATTTRPGLSPKLDNTATHFLNGQGAYVTPSITAVASPGANSLLPTGAVAQTAGRANPISSPQTILTGREYYCLVYIDTGKTCNSITWYSGGTALSAGTHQWSALRDLSRNLLAISPDDTSGAWSASSAKTFTYSTPYVTIAAGFYYVTMMVAATTPPTLIGVTSVTQVNTIPPIVNGNDATNTGRTDVASAPATGAALTVGTILAYAHINGS